MITQTDKVFGALLIGFLIYITVRGQLPLYMQLFTSADAPNPNAASSDGSTKPKASSFLDKIASGEGILTALIPDKSGDIQKISQIVSNVALKFVGA